MKKILFGITGLTLGGAERVLVDLVNRLSKNYEITIFTIYAKGELEKQVVQEVKIKSLFKTSYAELSKLQRIIVPLKILLKKNKIYQEQIRQNVDVEISFLEGPITRLFGCKNKETRKIAWIHNDISSVFGRGIKSKIKRKLDQSIYKQYETLVFVSQDNQKKFNEIYPNLKETIQEKVIYNYIEKETVLTKAKEKIEPFRKEMPSFVTVTRLVEQKAIDRLIEVHHQLIQKGYLHQFYVIGEGPERKKLETKIKEYHLEETFHLLGKKENPYPYIKQANYFCLLSYFEGYGMVLEEAKILEKPIIITDTAAREAVKGYTKTVILKNTSEAIEEGFKKIISGKEKIEDLKEEVYENTSILNQVIELVGE